MGLIRWFTKNWAHTHGPTHDDLAPLTLPVPSGEAADRVRAAVQSLPRWKVESVTADELNLTRRTGVVGFIDDITVRLTPDGLGTVVHAESRSRVGKGDLGQNRRNILELWAALLANA